MGKTNKPKFDYDDPKFYKTIEKLARQGLTDKSIAWMLVQEYGRRLSHFRFSHLKNEKDENGIYSQRALNIRKALGRGRVELNLLARQANLKHGLGGLVIKSKVTLYENYGTKNQRIIQITEFERELPPNWKVLNNWLMMNDEEWKKPSLKVETSKDIEIIVIENSNPYACAGV